MKFNGGRSRDEILAEVESVRSDMDSTLSAIERKLTPGQLVDQGLEYLRTSGANEFVSNLGNSVKQNPMPVALVGVCLAWLMASSRSGNASSSSQTSGMLRRATDATSGAWTGAREQARSTGRTLNDAAQSARERFDQARQSVSGTAQSAYDRLDQARQSVSSAAQSAYEHLGQARQSVAGTVQGGVQSAREALSHGADVAQRQIDRARGGFDWMMREQPLALGAIGVAVGALLASAAPRTRVENEWMGEASDRLTESAKDAGREQLERAGDVLRSAASPHEQQDSATQEHGEKMQGAIQGVSSSGTEAQNPAQQRTDQQAEWPHKNPSSG